MTLRSPIVPVVQAVQLTPLARALVAVAAAFSPFWSDALTWNDSTNWQD